MKSWNYYFLLLILQHKQGVRPVYLKDIANIQHFYLSPKKKLKKINETLLFSSKNTS